MGGGGGGGWGRVGGVRMDVNEELVFERGGSGWGVRVNVNSEVKFL